MTTENSNDFPDRTPDYILGRRQSRETLLGLLYEYASKPINFREMVNELPLEPDGYAKELAEALVIHLEEIDQKISDVSHSWDLDRMPLVDLAILRIAVIEIMRFSSVPAAAIVSEAVELGSKYSTETSGPFINGVLAEICRQMRPNEPVSAGS